MAASPPDTVQKQKGTCRYCGEAIFYGKHPDADKPEAEEHPRGWMLHYMQWRHQESSEEKCPDDGAEERYSTAEPKQWCMYTKGDGSTCYRAIEEAAQNDHLWACGIHMRQELAIQDQMRRSAEHRAQRQESDELREWARAALKEQLEAIKSTGLKVRWHDRGTWTAPNTSVEVEISDLLEWLHAHQS